MGQEKGSCQQPLGEPAYAVSSGLWRAGYGAGVWVLSGKVGGMREGRTCAEVRLCGAWEPGLCGRSLLDRSLPAQSSPVRSLPLLFSVRISLSAGAC